MTMLKAMRFSSRVMPMASSRGKAMTLVHAVKKKTNPVWGMVF
jgi:hypothetical protein